MHGYRDDPSVKTISVWKDTEALLQAHGISTLTVKMPQFGSIEQRSDKCIEQIRAKYGGQTVHLIAHSMVRFCLYGTIPQLIFDEIGRLKCCGHSWKDLQR